MKNPKNRWLIALAAIGIHISIGSVYAYSVLINPLMQQLGWNRTAFTFSFSIAIFFLGMSAAFMGRFVEKEGPRKSGMISAAFYGLGTAGAGLAVHLQSLNLFYLFYGVIGGIGLGIGYIAPVSTLVKWFPDRRGLATGLAIMGFGFASLIFGPVMAHLITTIGIDRMFYSLGALYFTIMFLSALYLEKPPEDWHITSATKNPKRKPKKDLAYIGAKEALKTRRFYYLWLMVFINITCGIAIISIASPFAQENAGMTAIAAAAMVGMMGLFNGAGRIFWASVSDHLGRSNVYVMFFAIQIAAFYMLPSATNPLIFQALVLIILTCYGGGFACMPAFIGDLFGTKELAAIHGYTLTAWSAAGIAGPMIASTIREKTQSYEATLYIFAGFFAIALATSLLMKRNISHHIRLRDSTEKETGKQ